MSNPGIIKRSEANVLTPSGLALDELLDRHTKQLLAHEITTTIRKGLRATKPDRITYKGEVTETYEDVDHMARLRASEIGAQITGLRSANKEATVNVQVNVVTPDWAIQGGKTVKTVGKGKRGGGG